MGVMHLIVPGGKLSGPGTHLAHQQALNLLTCKKLFVPQIQFAFGWLQNSQQLNLLLEPGDWL
jgi:hypothetical protein